MDWSCPQNATVSTVGFDHKYVMRTFQVTPNILTHGGRKTRGVIKERNHTISIKMEHLPVSDWPVVQGSDLLKLFLQRKQTN